MTVFEMIEAQQRGKENSTIWICGEQLKDICRSDPHCAAIVAEDLTNDKMSITACEKKIQEYADKQPRQGNKVGIPTNVAEKIIRDFYGLPAAGEKPKLTVLPQKQEKPKADFDLFDLL